MDFGFSVKVQQITKYTDMANVARKTFYSAEHFNAQNKLPFELFLYLLCVYQHKAHLLMQSWEII